MYDKIGEKNGYRIIVVGTTYSDEDKKLMR